jgi:hypothetical protein
MVKRILAILVLVRLTCGLFLGVGPMRQATTLLSDLGGDGNNERDSVVSDAKGDFIKQTVKEIAGAKVAKTVKANPFQSGSQWCLVTTFLRLEFGSPSPTNCKPYLIKGARMAQRQKKFKSRACQNPLLGLATQGT